MPHDHTSYFASGGDPLDIDALMAFHRARYGGFKMEDESDSADADADADSADADSSDADADAGDADDADADADVNKDSGADDTKDQLSHEDALEALKAARADAAKQRLKAKAALEKLESAKTPEEFESARDEILETAANDARDLLIENVALRHNLPDDLAELLQGDTREELDAHAKKLAKYAPQEDDDDSDPSGGLDPTGNGGSYDPVKAVAAERSRTRRF